ncbi:hypothetical protein LS69_010115, partial [Helicobacter sp. MIT 05-5294]
SLFYYENGNLEAKYCLKNGQFDGIQEMFYENGNLKIQGYFQDNESAGNLYIFRENGLLWYKIIIDKEEKVEAFDKSGKSLGYLSNKEEEQKIMGKLKTMFIHKY